MASTPVASQLRRGVLGPLALATVETRERYGLEVVRTLARFGLVTSEGTVYPLLTRLLNSGLMTSEWVIADGERPRRFYRITHEGQRELDLFRREWHQFKETVDSVLVSGNEGDGNGD